MFTEQRKMFSGELTDDESFWLRYRLHHVSHFPLISEYGVVLEFAPSITLSLPKRTLAPAAGLSILL